MRRERKKTREEVIVELCELVWDVQQIASYSSKEFADFRDAVAKAKGVLGDE